MSSRLRVARRGERTAAVGLGTLRAVVFVLEGVGQRRIRRRGKSTCTSEEREREGDERKVRSLACIRINIYVYIYALSGIRHPINLLLANRLANCERMLARANKGASIY